MKYNRYPKRDALKDYFPVPNEIFCLGLSSGEICGLKWSDFDEAEGKLNISRSVDLRNGKIIVGETKTGKGKRKFYLPLSTANVLRERKKNAVSVWIFADPICHELPIAPPVAYRKIKQLLKKAGLPDIRFHDLRHPYVKPTTKKFITFFEVFRAAS